MIEVHPNPKPCALSDGPQSLTLERYEQLMPDMAVIGKIFDRWPQTPIATATLIAVTHCV